MNFIYHRVYLAGPHGWIMPKKFKRVIAGSEFHRAWFLGRAGFFEQDGIKYGLASPYDLPQA
ncbi:hypothetical protein [Yoonia sp. MH D7]